MAWYDAFMNAMGMGNLGQPSQQTLGQVPGMVGGYLDPYSQEGQAQLDPLSQQYSQLMQDPTAMMSQIGQGFQASPGYQYNVDQATQGAMQAGAASGQAGSPAVQQALAGQISGLASQDYDTYMNQALGQYDTGLQGAQGLAGMGLQAGSTAAGLDAQNAQQQAMMQMMSQMQNAQSAGGLLGGITGGLL